MERDDLQRSDYGITIAVQTLIEAMGMYAENQQRIHRGESLAYPEKAFQKLIEKNGVHHNVAIERWF